MAVQLSKSGYGTAEQILKARVDTVVMMLEYEKFHAKYNETFIEMNREES